MLANSTGRSLIRAGSVAAPPDAVHAYLADGQNMPRWAPEFASTIRRNGDEWLVNEGEGEMRMLVQFDPVARSVDIVAASAPSLGLFMRVIPNGDGAAVLMAMCFPDGTAVSTIESQDELFRSELRLIAGEFEGEAPTA